MLIFRQGLLAVLFYVVERSEENKATGIVSAAELDFISQFVIIKYVEPEFGGGGWVEGGDRNRENQGGMQECTDMAEHHQMRERLEFYHQHPLPPFLPSLPCFAGGDMRGGARERGQGGLRRPEHSFNSPLLSSPLLSGPFIDGRGQPEASAS